MKKSVKLAVTAAAVLLTIGIITVAMLLQNGPQVNTPPADGSQPVGRGESNKVVVCFDIGNRIANVNEDGEYKSVVQGFLNWIDDCNKYYGLSISSEDIEVDVIPGVEADAATRSSALQRIRTEIMSGKGPDVFICSSFTAGGIQGDELRPMDGGRLFPYVEKSREEGLFLPLDECLSDLTLTDANDFILQLMEGGKNQNGEQVIIPLSFSVPGMIFSGDSSTNFYGENLPECKFEGTSWNDVLQGNDPLLAEQSVWAMNYYRFSDDYLRTGGHASGLFCLFPQTADFEHETPAFSEEELFGLVKDSIAGYRNAMEREPEQYSASVFFSPVNLAGGNAMFIPAKGYNPYTLVPMRNLTGGSTAMVTQYCAVNANTKKQEKAMAVLDALLTMNYQKNGALFQFFGDMPNSRTLTSPGNKYLESLEFDAQTFAQWQRVCDDINIVRFPSALDAELDSMMMEIEDAMYTYRNPASGIIIRDGQFLQGAITDEELRKIVSEHYRQMLLLLDES